MIEGSLFDPQPALEYEVRTQLIARTITVKPLFNVPPLTVPPFTVPSFTVPTFTVPPFTGANSFSQIPS